MIERQEGRQAGYLGGLVTRFVIAAARVPHRATAPALLQQPPSQPNVS
jgi:hypothetical protein